MSETDETDELLIIPPDFFLTNSVVNGYPDDSDPYYNIVDSLITQVGRLEDRVNTIQSSSELSFSLISNSTEKMDSPSRLRKFNSNDDLPHKMYSGSTQSTPQKPRAKFTLSSLPNSPDTNYSKRSPQKTFRSPIKSKRPEINPMLGEIDSFLSNVKLIKRLNAVRNLETDFSNLEEYGNQKSMDLHDVDEMLKEMDLQQRKMEKRIEEKEQELLKNKEKPVVREKMWQAGDNSGSVPDYGFGMKKFMHPTSKQSSTDTGSTNITSNINHPVSNERTESDDSSESTQMTAFENLKSTHSLPRVDFDILNQQKKCLDGGLNNFNLGLVSLSSLWGDNFRDNSGKFRQKLEEERLRRQHCEQAIKELQNRILELQEKVSVAIQVDEAKDKAIYQIHDSWEKAGSKLLEVESEKEKLEKELEKLTRKVVDESEEITQKISHYEREASKALNLAHTSQEKIVELEKHCLELENDLKTALINSEEFQKKYLDEAEKCRKYPEILAQKELELNECKSLLRDARQEVAQCKKAVEFYESELMSMKTENESLQSKLETEKNLSKKINGEKNKLLDEVNAQKDVAKGLQEELVKTRDKLENNKIELKNFYQGQVELVVQNKLREFQSQLDQAEKSLNEELAKKELSIAKTAASHIQQISEKHSLEIKLLEEKHQEECRLYAVHISQLQHESEECHLKLKRQHDKQTHIEKQLYRFMETLKQDHVNSIDELNSFRSKSFTNLEEILAINTRDDERNKKEDESSEKNSHQTYRIGETPFISRADRGCKRKEPYSLQDTIQMLLDKRPQSDVRNNEESQQATKEGTSSHYQRILRDMKGKPPWK